MSEVNSSSKHDAISFTAVQSFRKVGNLIPPGIPIILEAVIPEDQIIEQLRLAAAAFLKSGAVA